MCIVVFGVVVVVVVVIIISIDVGVGVVGYDYGVAVVVVVGVADIVGCRLLWLLMCRRGYIRYCQL